MMIHPLRWLFSTNTHVLYVYDSGSRSTSNNKGQRILMKGRMAGGFFMEENLMWHSCASAVDKGTGAVAYVCVVGPVRAIAF